jgi:hypothetical protein
MGAPPKDTSFLRAAGRKLAGPLTSNPQSRDGTIEDYGLRSEVLHITKLSCATIIPTAEQKIYRATKIQRSQATSWR